MNAQRAKDVMTNLVVLVHPGDPVEQVAKRLVRNRISGAPVVHNGKVLGVVSEIDLSRALARSATCTAAEVMSTPAITIEPDASLFKAAQRLERHGIKRLPVVDAEGFLLGIVSRGDLVRALAASGTDIPLATLSP